MVKKMRIGPMYDKELYAAYGYQLDESDADYRNALRKWKSSKTKENATKLATAAQRSERLIDPEYYDALWTIGERPNRHVIYARAMMVADMVDKIVLGLNTRVGHFRESTVVFTRTTMSNSTTWDKYYTLISRAIQQSEYVTKDNLEDIVAYLGGFIKHGKQAVDRLYPGLWGAMLGVLVRCLEIRVNYLRALVGQQPTN
jgi:hypothetical protein